MQLSDRTTTFADLQGQTALRYHVLFTLETLQDYNPELTCVLRWAISYARSERRWRTGDPLGEYDFDHVNTQHIVPHWENSWCHRIRDVIYAATTRYCHGGYLEWVQICYSSDTGRIRPILANLETAMEAGQYHVAEWLAQQMPKGERSWDWYDRSSTWQIRRYMSLAISRDMTKLLQALINAHRLIANLRTIDHIGWPVIAKCHGVRFSPKILLIGDDYTLHKLAEYWAAEHASGSQKNLDLRSIWVAILQYAKYDHSERRYRMLLEHFPIPADDVIKLVSEASEPEYCRTGYRAAHPRRYANLLKIVAQVYP